MSHRTGSYWEMSSTGTYTMKSVLDMNLLAKEDLFVYAGGNYTQQILGQSYRYTAGDNVIKSDGTIYLDSNRVQVNAGMMAVTGEINSPSINAEVFTGPFADVLAKESMLAWDLGHGGGGGSAPAMINNSLGFMGNDGSESLLTNKLATHSPSGTLIITNGIPRNTVIDPLAITSTSAVNTASSLANAVGVSIFSGNAINAAAAAIDAAAIAAGNNTPVFIKHVSLDKPLLLSQSTVAKLPDPTLYVNNIHTIVNPSTGVGEVHISNGIKWIPLGSGSASQQVILGIVNSTVGDATADQLAAEQVARNKAILAEAVARQQAISSGLLTEAQARGAAIIAESTIRQSAEQSLSDHIITLTASTGANASAIQQEQTARTNGDSANATATQTVAATAATNTASIISNATTAANASSALGVRIDAVTATTGQNTAAIASEVTTRTTADTALGTRIDTVIVNVATNTASIISDAAVAANASSANASLISSLTTTVGGNTATISTQQSSINGINANYGVKINANGAVSGFGLLSTLVGSTPISKFTIQADAFSLINPAGGSTAVAPFTVTANGNLSISGNLNAVGGTFIGTVSAGTILGGDFVGYGWPATGKGGYYIGPQGILIGNYNGGGNYFQYDQAAGSISMPGLYISGGNANFSGNIAGASGTFSGSLTASGVITTGNVAGNAITQSSATSGGAGSGIAISINCTGGSIEILAYGTPYPSTTSGTGDSVIYVPGYTNLILRRDADYSGGESSGYISSTSGRDSSSSLMYIDNPGIGTHTYSINQAYAGGPNVSNNNPYTFISVKEFKR